MSFVTDLKNNKDKQDEWLDKAGQYPKLIRLAAKTANFGARVISPLVALCSAIKDKNPRQIASLHKIIRHELEDKLKSYASLMGANADDQGFIEHECCDALLFTGLVGSTQYWNPIITAARDEEGKWQRRQAKNPCFPHGSRSTISRDMFLGLFWYMWRKQRLDLAEELWDYGVKNDWIMGDGDVSRIYMTPGLQATLAEIIYQLGGKNHWAARNMPQSWPQGLEGFQCHLEVLHILLRGELLGYIDNKMSKALDDMCSRHIDNHLYTVAKARFASEISTTNYLMTCAAVGLEDIKLWPQGRLPNDADRSSRWIFENNDTTPGDDPGTVHTGGDLIFCASLIMDYSDTID